MDDHRPRYPQYVGEEFLQSTPSYWPLSHIRSSVDERDVSPPMFDRYFVDDTEVGIPLQDQTIKNLTGRSIEESFSSLYGAPPETPRKGCGCPTRSKGHPCCPYGEYYLNASASDGESDTVPKAKRRQTQSSRIPEISDEVSSMVLDERDTVHRHTTRASANGPRGDQRMMVDKPPENPPPRRDAETLPKARVTGQTHRIIRPSPASPTLIAPPIQTSLASHPPMSINSILNHDAQPVRRPEPRPGSQPISPTVSNKQDNHHRLAMERVRRLPQRQSAPTSFYVDPSDEDEDNSDSFHGTPSTSSVSVPVKPKTRQKPVEQGSHICKICNITFTRNFDLQRHNQRHKEETEEDKARRTCTNCNRLLSRVDATKRHVDTLPDSCNHIRKKEGKGMLPPMPQSHYDACKEKYYKLAQETKKPKGRKRAVAAP